MTRSKLTLACVVLLLSFGVALTSGCKRSNGAISHIERERAVTIATHPVNEPLEFGKGTGVQGFDVDIGEEIANTLGVKTRWVKASSFPNLFELLQGGEVDLVISSISITRDREKTYAFSEPYYTSGQAVVVTNDNKDIKSFEDLKGKKIGVQAQTTGEAFVKKGNVPGIQVNPYPTLEDALQALNAKEIDAVIGDYPIVAYLIYKRYGQLRIAGDRLNQEKYGVMLRKEETELLDVVNRTLKRLHETHKYNEFVKNWFGEFEMNREAKRRQAQALAASAITPKTVIFRLHRALAYKEFDMSRLDGFQIVLQGRDSDRVYTSSPILTEGTSGTCHTSALPGKYALNLKRIGLSAELEIPSNVSKSVTFTISISRNGVVIQRT